MSDSRAKILVIRGGAIGDFILTLPVLTALRAQFPAVRLEVLGYAHIAQLAVAGGLADAVRSIEAASLAAFFARDGHLPDALQEYFSGFAIILSYLYDPDDIFRDNIARCSKAQFIQGPHRPDESAGRHAADVFLEPLQRLAIFDADPEPRLSLKLPAHQRSSPDSLAPPIPPNDRKNRSSLALHPGSGSPRKNWPEDRWAALMDKLCDGLCDGNGESLLLVGGEAEGERLTRLASGARCPVEIAAHRPLPELAARLAACRLFVGHDSGITHLAAAVGLEGVVLWGESVEQVWHPRSSRMHIVRAGAALARLPVEEIHEIIRGRLHHSQA